MIKLIVCDFDGTILNRDTQLIYPKVSEAIRQASRNGIQFCAATGRNAPAARRILEDSGVEGWLIDLNGAELRTPEGECLEIQQMDRELVGELLSHMIHPEVLTTVYSGEKKITFLPVHEHYERYFTVPGCGKTKENTPLSRFEEEYRSVQSLDEITDPIFKIEMRSASLEAIRQIRRKLEQDDRIALTSAFTHNLEVLSPTCNKAACLTSLQQRLGLADDEIAVFGDDLNDLCLFEQFPESYAVANARPEILRFAKHRIPACDEEGPAEAVYKIIRTQ